MLDQSDIDHIAARIADRITPPCGRWLTLKEACRYSSIGLHRLKKLASDGTIKGTPDPDNGRGDWIFDKESIDAYREGQMTVIGAREKALAILKGVRL